MTSLESAYRTRWAQAVDRKWVSASKPEFSLLEFVLGDLECEFWRGLAEGQGGGEVVASDSLTPPVSKVMSLRSTA
jgi:hypothetical protein